MQSVSAQDRISKWFAICLAAVVLAVATGCGNDAGKPASNTVGEENGRRSVNPETGDRG